jgi:ribosomal protein S18 acetylase RimI-like enzyme
MAGAPTIRGVTAADIPALYEIALITGDAGADATALYRDPQLVGALYAVPYAVLEPQSAFVIEDGEGVAGYIVGAADTPAFEARLEAEWWPALRERHADPAGDPAGWNLDQISAWQIHHPGRTPRRLTEPYPSHLHINLRPRLQGQRLGRAMIETWLAAMRTAGSRGVHLGVSVRNARGLAFYPKLGFAEFQWPKRRAEAGAIYFTMPLPSSRG